MYLQQEFDDTKRVIRISITPRRTDNTMEKGQNDNQGSTKHYTENSKDRSTRNPLQCNTRVNSDAPEG